VEHARGGEGVTLLEVVTYRRLGHAQHDDQSYQSVEEIERWAAENDPLDRYTATLLEKGWATREELDGLDAEVAAELDRAVAEAESAPLPEAEEARDDVLKEVRVNAPWTRLAPPDPRAA
jgi:pyruvate dehydrogenase E1 component alpha subunit